MLQEYNCRIEWKGTSNFGAGRKSRKPLAIVNHITAGLMPGALSWLQNPASRASAHFLITRLGQIFQLVREEDTAWANGIVNKPNWTLYDGNNPNFYTLSIEHEALSDDNLTEEQYQASLYLHRLLISRFNITVDEEHIIGHYRIDSVNRPNCPGPQFPWKRLFTDLKGERDWSGKMPDKWKVELMQEARKLGLLSEQHNPDDQAAKWFVLAVAINLLKQKGNCD